MVEIWWSSELNSPIPVHFSSLIPRMLTFTLGISFYHFQFALIHGPDIPDSYAILLFTTLDLASISSHIHNWGCFCFGCVLSFFLELFPHWSPVACWAPTDLGSSSFSVLFAFSYCSWISRGKNTEVVCHFLLHILDHILSELSTMTHLSWVALHGMAHHVIELDKAVIHVIRLVSFLWLWFSFCLSSLG